MQKIEAIVAKRTQKSFFIRLLPLLWRDNLTFVGLDLQIVYAVLYNIKTTATDLVLNIKVS